MKRSIVTYAGMLGAAYAGILGLSQSFPSQALAASQELCYSTGPIENAFQVSGLPGQSETVFVKVLNNSNNNVDAEVLVFSLDGAKRLNFSDEFPVGPQSSAFRNVSVADKFQFEVQVELQGAGLEVNPDKKPSVLLGAFGKDKNGNLVAAHRVVHSEFTKIPCVNNDNT
jgi:hypothetical protein